MKFDFENLQNLLRKRVDDPTVIDLIGSDHSQIERTDYLGYMEFKKYGVSVRFKEAPWVVPVPLINDRKAIRLDAFHFHREGTKDTLSTLVSFQEALPLVIQRKKLFRNQGNQRLAGAVASVRYFRSQCLGGLNITLMMPPSIFNWTLMATWKW